MKSRKILFILFIALAIFMIACNENNKPNEIEDENAMILSVRSKTIEVGNTVSITPDIYDKKEVNWSFSDPSVLSMDEYYRITALKIGTCVVTCTLIDDDEVTGSIEISVVAQKPVISTNSDVAIIGKSQSIIVSNYELSELSFSSSNSSVASVDDKGVINPKSSGKATITVSLKGSDASASLEITVTDNAKSITEKLVLAPVNGNGTYNTGEVIEMDVLNGLDNANYEWSTNKVSIARVIDNGMVFTNGEGEVTIYAYSKKDNSLKGSYTIQCKGSGEGNIDYVSRVLKIAYSQIGYIESGDNNTKYGAWYGLNNQPWCAMFVSWCLYHAGVPLDNGVTSGIAPRYASVALGMQWFEEHNCFYYKENYTPVAGDIIIFKSDGASHTGIVVKSENGRVFTIEGNTSDMVAERNYQLDYSKITGYGHIDFPTYNGQASNFDTTGSTGGENTKTE